MRKIILLVASLVLAGTSARATDPQLMREAISMAAEICGEYERAGDKNEFELSGSAQAKVKGLFRNFVDAGVDVEGSRSGEEYNNVVRDELAKELLSTRDCRQDMSKYLIDKLSSASPERGGQNDGGSGTVIHTSVQPDLSGLWRFQGTCPNPTGFGTVAVSGEFQMQKMAPGTYQGSIYNNYGYTGNFQTTASGGYASTQVVWSDYSVSQSNGVLSADGRVMDIQDTSGCFSRAFKVN